MTLTLRPAVAADAEAIGAMAAQLREDQGSEIQLPLRDLVGRAREQFAAGWEAVLFDVSGATVGYAFWENQPDGVFLHAFFTVRERRRTGLGRAAIEALWAGPWSGRRVRLTVLMQNPRGQAFWRALGFSDHSIQMERRR